MGRGRSGKGNAAAKYESIPVIFRFRGGSSQATDEQKKQRRETISRFMEDAKEGDVYSVGSGFGSAGGQRFTVTRSRGKLALGWIDSDGYTRRPVQMNRANVEEFISNGATLVSRRKKT